MVGMINRPKKQDQIDMVLRNLQLRFARRLSFMWGIVEKLVNEKNMSNEGDTTFGGDTTLGLQGYK